MRRLRDELILTGMWTRQEMNYESYKKSRGWREEDEALGDYRARILQLAERLSLRLVANLFGLTRQALQHWRKKQVHQEQLVRSFLAF